MFRFLFLIGFIIHSPLAFAQDRQEILNLQETIEQQYRVEFEARNIQGAHPCDADGSHMSRFLSDFREFAHAIYLERPQRMEVITIVVEPENCEGFISYVTGGNIRLGRSNFRADVLMSNLNRIYAGHRSAEATIQKILDINAVIGHIRWAEKLIEDDYGLRVRHSGGLTSVYKPRRYFDFLLEFLDIARTQGLDEYDQLISAQVEVRRENWNPLDSNLVGPDVYERYNHIYVGHRSAQALFDHLIEAGYYEAATP